MANIETSFSTTLRYPKIDLAMTNAIQQARALMQIENLKRINNVTTEDDLLQEAKVVAKDVWMDVPLDGPVTVVYTFIALLKEKQS